MNNKKLTNFIMIIMAITLAGCSFTEPETPETIANMVEVPAGEFTMGADADVGFEACKKYYIGREDECERSWYEDEEPEHTVYVDAYYMDKYEVTNAEYAEFLNEKGNQTEGDVTWLDLGDYELIEYSGNQFKTKSGFAKHPVNVGSIFCTSTETESNSSETSTLSIYNISGQKSCPFFH